MVRHPTGRFFRVPDYPPGRLYTWVLTRSRLRLGQVCASDSDIPTATRQIQPCNNQEERCPAVDAVRQTHNARGGRDTGTGNTRDPKGTQVAVLSWVDQAVQAGSRGR